MIKQDISAAMIEAMRAKDKNRLGTIRLIQAAIKQKEVDERIELDDVGVISVLDKMLKQRKESIKQFESANRDDLVAKETFELKIIQSFLPKQLSKEEIQDLIAAAIQEVNASSIKDMGKVMNIVRPKLQGRANMGDVSTMIKDKLS